VGKSLPTCAGPAVPTCRYCAGDPLVPTCLPYGRTPCDGCGTTRFLLGRGCKWALLFSGPYCQRGIRVLRRSIRKEMVPAGDNISLEVIRSKGYARLFACRLLAGVPPLAHGEELYCARGEGGCTGRPTLLFVSGPHFPLKVPPQTMEGRATGEP
jgi:hypothetical protein